MEIRSFEKIVQMDTDVVFFLSLFSSIGLVAFLYFSAIAITILKLQFLCYIPLKSAIKIYCKEFCFEIVAEKIK